LAAGTPVLAVDRGGVRDIVRPGVDGVMISDPAHAGRVREGVLELARRSWNRDRLRERAERRGCPRSSPSASWPAAATQLLDVHLDRLRGDAPPANRELEARRVVEDLAVALQASLLVRHAPVALADAFCAGRLGEGGRVFGTLPPSIDVKAIVERALAG
jgi:hypothetical protein